MGKIAEVLSRYQDKPLRDWVAEMSAALRRKGLHTQPESRDRSTLAVASLDRERRKIQYNGIGNMSGLAFYFQRASDLKSLPVEHEPRLRLEPWVAASLCKAEPPEMVTKALQSVGVVLTVEHEASHA